MVDENEKDAHNSQWTHWWTSTCSWSLPFRSSTMYFPRFGKQSAYIKRIIVFHKVVEWHPKCSCSQIRQMKQIAKLFNNIPSFAAVNPTALATSGNFSHSSSSSPQSPVHSWYHVLSCPYSTVFRMYLHSPRISDAHQSVRTNFSYISYPIRMSGKNTAYARSLYKDPTFDNSFGYLWIPSPSLQS